MRYLEPTIVPVYTEVEVNESLYDEMEKFSLATQTHPQIRPDWLRFVEKNPVFAETNYRNWVKPGSLVYTPYGATSPGVVISTFNCEYWRRGDRKEKKPLWIQHIAHVRWLPGKKESKKKNPEIVETLEHTDNLQSFKALIADHKKKLDTHESKVKLLEDLLWTK